MPSFGHLQPGEKQKVALCFYAQENVDREITALCHVDEGPTYKLKLRGEASVIQYSVHPTLVDFGRQVRLQDTQSYVGYFWHSYCFSDWGRHHVGSAARTPRNLILMQC